MLTESVGNHLKWLNQPVTGPPLCQLCQATGRSHYLEGQMGQAMHINMPWGESSIDPDVNATFMSFSLSLSLSTHTACIHVYQILNILLTKKNYPHTNLYVYLNIYIYMYMQYIHIIHDRWYRKWPRARTQQITVDTENPPFVDHFPCICVCHIYGNSKKWQFTGPPIMSGRFPSGASGKVVRNTKSAIFW